MPAKRGEYNWNTRSTPSPYDTFRTVKLDRKPARRRAIQTPSKFWILSLLPSTIRTRTRTLSPGRKSEKNAPEDVPAGVLPIVGAVVSPLEAVRRSISSFSSRSKVFIWRSLQKRWSWCVFSPGLLSRGSPPCRASRRLVYSSFGKDLQRRAAHKSGRLSRVSCSACL